MKIDGGTFYHALTAKMAHFCIRIIQRMDWNRHSSVGPNRRFQECNAKKAFTDCDEYCDDRSVHMWLISLAGKEHWASRLLSNREKNQPQNEAIALLSITDWLPNIS